MRPASRDDRFWTGLWGYQRAQVDAWCEAQEAAYEALAEALADSERRVELLEAETAKRPRRSPVVLRESAVGCDRHEQAHTCRAGPPARERCSSPW